MRPLCLQQAEIRIEFSDGRDPERREAGLSIAERRAAISAHVEHNISGLAFTRPAIGLRCLAAHSVGPASCMTMQMAAGS
jgi:hypothetical protein